jgi:hypothetical protein
VNVPRRPRTVRPTPVVVHERLRAEGFLDATLGGGTFVSDDVRPRASGPPAESGPGPAC